ncbi:MAG: hypothetical protein ACN6RD_03035, partial [Stenotrophomonas maltophilia]
GVGLSAFLRVPRRFRRCEPPIIAGFFTSSTPRFEVVDSVASSFDPEVFSSKRAAYYVRLFVSVNTFFRSLLPSLRVGVHRGEDRVAARERILKTSGNSSRLLFDLFHRRVIVACCSTSPTAARALRVLPLAC